MTKLVTLLIVLALAASAWAQETDVNAEAAVETPDSDAEVVETGEAEDEAPGLKIFDAADVALDDFLWTSRPIVVFADTPADPRFQEQLALLTARPEELQVRDVIVITDTDPGARSAVRLKLRPRGFQLALLGKDGRVNLRKPFAWDVREITHAIDKWPLRQEEIRARGTSGG